jgi:magnesium-transporting ATPase (P-type)
MESTVIMQNIFNLICRDVESSWRSIENDLKFLGATAVDDKLQDGAEDTITYARQAGIRVVMATGDAVSTAVAIWNKLGQVTGKITYLIAVDEHGRYSKEEILASFKELVKEEKDDELLVVDGEVLNFLLVRPYQTEFKKLLKRYKSVVAARSSAVQKAELIRIYRELKFITLAIGDGGNDVTMLQRAHVGKCSVLVDVKS